VASTVAAILFRRDDGDRLGDRVVADSITLLAVIVAVKVYEPVLSLLLPASI